MMIQPNIINQTAKNFFPEREARIRDTISRAIFSSRQKSNGVIL
jgi:hypothetical protein